MQRLILVAILAAALLTVVWLLKSFGLAGLAPGLAVLAMSAKLALIPIKLIHPKSRYREWIPPDPHQNLLDQLDETGRLDLERLVELEIAFNQLVDNKIDEQFIAAEIPSTFRFLKSETAVVIEQRNQYRQKLAQTDVLRLQTNLERNHSAIAEEDDIQIQSKLIAKGEKLKQQLEKLKKINSDLERLDRDIDSSLTALHATIIFLSEPITQDYNNQLRKQADRLRQAVEISQEINTELSRYNSD